jgi:anti-sigma regulatory factor (Ser/Thr protein kinase)
MEAVRHQITIKADAAQLSGMRQQVFELCTADDVPTHEARLMVLAIDEAISNVIEHADLDQDNRFVELSIEIDEQRIVAEILDRGKSFDPTPRRAEPVPGQYPKRGFGLYLIHKIVDSMEYARTDDGRNLLRLTKKL